ncbi:outer membrane beta-barrel protein [Thalassotalea psychrophila]|uniref:Outer membrane beta-barrel protein n=1 Tax=Thalassotalea psychrophila TaxID=3065647 RepID=A0ABY9TTU4_9GAMM|nr:outer membrane beta-barrel protein [Colwelliaceae bacterium SQ149]
MNSFAKLTTLTIAFLLSISVYAQTYEYNNFQPNQQYYLGLSIGHGIHVEDSFSEFALTTLTARLGYNYTSNIGFEVRYASGLSEDEIDSFDRELDSLMGIYAVYTYPVQKKLNLFAIAGITDLEIIQNQHSIENDIPSPPSLGGVSSTIPQETNQNQSNIKKEFSETGPSLGAGIEYKINNRARWILEAMIYVDGSDVDYGQISGGFRISF